MNTSLQSLFDKGLCLSRLVCALLVLTGLVACAQRAAPIGNVTSDAAETSPVATAMPIAPPGEVSRPTSVAPPVAAAPFSTEVLAQAPAVQTGSAVIVTGGPGNLGELKLSLVQACTQTRSGNTCQLFFIEGHAGQDAAVLTREYFSRVGGEATPKTSVESPCSPGWVAAVVSQQGTVQGGGILRAYAAVCGHPNAASALNAAFNSCDGRTQGGCRQSSRVNVLWGRWAADRSGSGMGEPGRPLDAASLVSGQRCDSAIPLVESAQCSGAAASQLRLFGLR